MKDLATLTRHDGIVAVLAPELVWHSTDERWAEMLNLLFDPTLRRGGSVGGMPAYVATVAAAAEHFQATPHYPWSDSPPREDVVY